MGCPRLLEKKDLQNLDIEKIDAVLTGLTLLFTDFFLSSYHKEVNHEEACRASSHFCQCWCYLQRLDILMQIDI